MSGSRLIELQPVNEIGDYHAQLQRVISKYIESNQQNNPASQGVKRALALQRHISFQLIEIEKLNKRQLLWRMLDYVGMEDGCGPLGTSKILRTEISSHLCRYLKISDLVIQDALELLQVYEIKMSMGMYVPPGAMHFSECYDLETQAMLQSARDKIIAIPFECFMVENNVANKLSGIIQAYENTASRWFAAKGIVCAAHLRKVMTDQWLALEHLDERQLVCRLYEHLAMPTWGGQGLFGNSRDLRSRMLTAICQYLQLNEVAMTMEIREICRERVVPFSHLGPVLQMPDDQLVEINVRLKHIDQALTYREAPQQRVIVEDLQTKSAELQMVTNFKC